MGRMESDDVDGSEFVETVVVENRRLRR